MTNDTFVDDTNKYFEMLQQKEPICYQNYNCYAKYWAYKIGKVDYANAFLLRSFKLSLQIEDA